MISKKRKTTSVQARPILLFALGLCGLALLLALLLYGTDIKLLNPKGFIAQEQFELIVFSTIVLLAIGIPALFFFYYFAWKYRDTNKTAAYEPNPRHGKRFVFAVWAIPSLFALMLTPAMWSGTHRLEPNDPIVSENRPLNIQVVALRWKWLFIYPEQNIATVNFVQIPTDTPVQFDLTADEAPMSSFWIPHLGGQLYAMTGHVNRLNLMAEKPGDYTGQTAEINGPGFAGMKFVTRASSQVAFDEWVKTAQSSPTKLDAVAYYKLLEPSESHPIETYSLADTETYDKVLMKYMGSHEGSHGSHEQGYDDISGHKDNQHDTHHTGHQ